MATALAARGLKNVKETVYEWEGRDKNGKIPKPTLWDIADSAAWANRCDAGVVIYRPDMQNGNLTEISIEKSRDTYAIGTPGTVSLQWQAETSRFARPA
jgi:twinkle protein